MAWVPAPAARHSTVGKNKGSW